MTERETFYNYFINNRLAPKGCIINIKKMVDGCEALPFLIEI